MARSQVSLEGGSERGGKGRVATREDRPVSLGARLKVPAKEYVHQKKLYACVAELQ